MLGILAIKSKRYSLAIRYLEMTVNLYSFILNLGKDWDDLNLQEIQFDKALVRGTLIIAHDYLAANFEDMGLVREAANHVEKSCELSTETANLALSSVQGTCYYNLSVWALKCLQFDRALDLGDKSVELFIGLPPDIIENRVQLGKAQRLVALMYLIKGNEEKSEKWMYDYEGTMHDFGAHIWFDILYIEVELQLWKGVYTECEDRLDSVLSLDLNVSHRIKTLLWKLILHHHQKNEQQFNQCSDTLQGLIKESGIEIEEKAKHVYELSRLLYINKHYTVARDLVEDVLNELWGFALDSVYDLRGRLSLLQGEILVSLNAEGADAMESFDRARFFLNECFPKTHYVIAQLNQNTARAHLAFGNTLMARQLLKEAREVIHSFSPHSLTFMKLNFDFVEFYVRTNKLRSAVELLEEMVETMETGRVTPHEPFCHDSKWQCAELASEPHDTLLENAKAHLQELKIAHPYLKSNLF
ncbi:hypothetical protein C5167_007806 [Papaver somniferum]|uniref:uncharacterized protein LOC113342563 n=1 Tax=Papaver somniferum TaxID=3469 RepID=UPI000E6FC1D8|nr:uncharacterized protein LOC113342563 [Papaver somniferum]RZC92747.1 hypothetical protein C5167_007806 [Papaver somniferum]